VLAVGGAASVALADIVAPANAGHLTAVGPVSASNGFPTWYKDDAGTSSAGGALTNLVVSVK
jgi:hypothetical protein